MDTTADFQGTLAIEIKGNNSTKLITTDFTKGKFEDEHSKKIYELIMGLLNGKERIN